MLKHSRSKNIATAVVIILFFLNTAFYIAVLGENVPYWDEWSTSYSIAMKTSERNLTLPDLFVQHVNHRIVFTNLLTSFSTLLWQWNLKAEMFVSLLLAAGCFIMVALMSERSRWFLIAAAAMIFSIKQDWLWSFNSQSHFAVFFILLTILNLRRAPRLRNILFACIASVCATYSFGYGFTVWGLGFLLLLIARAPRRHILLWMVVSVTNVGLFLATHESSSAITIAPIDLSLFVLIYIGGAFVPNYSALLPFALMIGTLGIIWMSVNCFLLYRRGRLSMFWVVIALYAIGVGFIIASGRISFGIGSGLAERYAIMSNLFWLSALFIARGVFRYSYIRFINSTFVAVLIAFYVISFSVNWLEPGDTRIACIEEFTDVCEMRLYPDEDAVVEAIANLQRLHISWFADNSQSP